MGNSISLCPHRRPSKAPGRSPVTENHINDLSLQSRQIHFGSEDDEGENVGLVGSFAGVIGSCAESSQAIRLQAVVARQDEDQRNYPLPPYLDQYQNGIVNIAVSGQSGQGKSSFINAIRKVTRSDPHYAPVGAGEQTSEPTPYSFSDSLPGLLRKVKRNARAIVSRVAPPGSLAIASRLARSLGNQADDEVETTAKVSIGDYIVFRDPESGDQKSGTVVCFHDSPNNTQLSVHVDGVEVTIGIDDVEEAMSGCILWDLPGVGTERFPQSTYIQNMGIRYFDMVILLTGDRFTEGEKQIMQDLLHWSVPFFLVRTKLDSAISKRIDDEAEDVGGELTEAQKQAMEDEVVLQLRQYFAQLRVANPNLPPEYLISTKVSERSKHDFQRLVRDMHLAFANEHRIDLQQTCPICFETYHEYGGEHDYQMGRMRCGHQFCRTCISASTRCAICKEAA